jgi:signal transduction histidine kinase
MVLGAPDGRPLPEGTLALLASIGRQVGGAMENALLYRQAQGAAALAERQRLARDLHDSVTQSLYAALLYAKAADRLLAAGEPAQAAEYVGALQISAQGALQEMRQLIFELRPAVLDEEGLPAALQARLEAVEARAGLSARLEVDGDLRLPPAVAEGLYRIAQEALNNVLRHAQARHVAVTLRRDGDELTLQVADDGQGCHPESAAGGLGWRGMRERAEALGARLSITGEPGRGTTVRVEMRVARLS